MRERSSRRTKARTAAGLGLAVLVVVGWILVRARPGSEAESMDEPVAPATSTETLGAESLSSSPPSIARGSRFAETPAADEASPLVTSSTAPRDAGTIRLVGDIRDPLGDLLDDAGTKLELQLANERRAVPIVQGTYVVDGLTPGDYELHCSSPGYFDVGRVFTIERDATEHREDVDLTTLWIVGIRLLAPDGRDFRDRELEQELPDGGAIDVVATSEPPPDHWTEPSFERISERGASTYERRAPADPHLSGDPDDTCSGSLEIRLPPPVYVSAAMRGFVLATTRLDAKETIATLEIPLGRLLALRCSLRGRIVSAEDGNPIAHVQAQLHVRNGSVGVESDASGEIRKDGLAPGPATLMIGAPGRGFETMSLELSPGIETDLGTIRLGRAITHIRGRFVDDRGRGVLSDGCVVSFEGADPLRSPEWRVGPAIQVDAEGKFEIDGLAARKYVLSCSFTRTRYLPRIVDLSSGSIEDLVVEVRPSSTVRLLPTSAKARSYAWWILSADRLLCACGSFLDREGVPVTLVPGSFILCAGPDASSAREIPFTVGSGTMVVEVGP